MLDLQPGLDGKARPYRIEQPVALVERQRLEAEGAIMHRCHHLHLFRSDNGACWIADARRLTYGSIRGPTPDAALAEVETAVAARLAVQAKP